VALREAVPAKGLAAIVPSSGASLRDIGRDALAIARDGLRARGRKNAAGRDETIYLDPLDAIIAGAPNQAEHWLSRYHGAWAGDVRHIFTEAAI
jgi:glutamate--cysteine ligase